MKIIFNILLYFIPLGCFAQSNTSPEYIVGPIGKKENILKTSDPGFFYVKPIQYIGTVKASININYNNHDKYNPELQSNYERITDSLNAEYNNRHYNNLNIFVDTVQTTPLEFVITDMQKITIEELDLAMEMMNEGKKPLRDIPVKTEYYDGFPVTISNQGSENPIIGFGNHLPLELEVLDQQKRWKTVYGVRRYGCGYGVDNYIILKQNEIATVFEPRLKGDFKTKFRYRLANIVSNEFIGNIDPRYIPD
ncbi:hypothetical protein [Chryseobacterium sp.]|uniref:hypothetical protein n=1 Tax=Chryseobacterium sp. TaxID=1871047 RepID=UPI0011C7FE8A|nr:hypothetical protein [Chryseobacterium sp.]TXF79449.1 hypothetical protein FUA25_03425 [Chryseobacterium sp.]